MIDGKNTIDNAEEERQSESHYSLFFFISRTWKNNVHTVHTIVRLIESTRTQFTDRNPSSTERRVWPSVAVLWQRKYCTAVNRMRALTLM